MSSKEIKCPHCKQWTLWAGGMHDRCLYCDGFLDSYRFTTQIENKLRNEIRSEHDPIFVRHFNSDAIKNSKGIVKLFRIIAAYLQIAFIAFISLILFLLSLASG